MVEEAAFPEAQELAIAGHIQGSQANNSVLTSFCWKGQGKHWQVQTSVEMDLSCDNFILSFGIIPCPPASFLLPYPLSPNPTFTPTQSQFCLPQILFSGGEQLTHTGPPYAHHKSQFPRVWSRTICHWNTLCSLTVQILGSTHWIVISRMGKLKEVF